MMKRVAVTAIVSVLVVLPVGCSTGSDDVTGLDGGSSAASGSSSPSSAPESSVSPSDSVAASAAAGRVSEAMNRVRDESFIGILSVESVQYGDMMFADAGTVVAVARNACMNLVRGVPRPQVVASVAENYGGDTARAEEFTTQAVAVYCPAAGP